MTISRAEFLRTLPAAVTGAIFQVEGELIRHGDETRGWSIRLARLPSLKIGLLDLPRHEVEISFDGYSEPEASAFLARFELCFRRGGG
jgi:hypothetical protein